MSAISTPEHVRLEISVWMRRRGLNQTQLADRMGVHQTWVSARLTGKTGISVEDLEALGRALGVPAAEFFRDSALDGSTNYRSA
jgi:transcriptional regulator with XRE-family HTH domain